MIEDNLRTDGNLIENKRSRDDSEFRREESFRDRDRDRERERERNGNGHSRDYDSLYSYSQDSSRPNHRVYYDNDEFSAGEIPTHLQRSQTYPNDHKRNRGHVVSLTREDDRSQVIFQPPVSRGHAGAAFSRGGKSRR
jgi:hypothetical protein